MDKTFFEFKVKGFVIKADKEFISISNPDNEIIKVSYKQAKEIIKQIITKAKELSNSQEIKKLDK